MDFVKRLGLSVLSLATAWATVLPAQMNVFAAEQFSGQLTTVTSVKANDNVVDVKFNDGAVSGKITFLEDGIFRYNVDPKGEFNQYATPNEESHTATIQAQSDNSNKYSHPAAKVTDKGNTFEISSTATTIVLDKKTAKMSIKNKAGETILSEAAPLTIGKSTVQKLSTSDDEYFFGGGTQNGRFSHKGKTINIMNESSWVDGGVSSPNPFYWSSKGYGVLRNTFQPGKYNFADGQNDVDAVHWEKEFDAYYFVSNDNNAADTAKTLLNGYYTITGNPMLLPEYSFYLSHLNCYNRDGWREAKEGDRNTWELEDGKIYKELGQGAGYEIPADIYAETLNNEGPSVDASNFHGIVNEDTRKFSAQAVIDGYANNDMPLGWFLPNDGYGCGYGQNGYYQKRAEGEDMTRMTQVVDANVANLKKFTEYAEAHGVRTGLWTQAALTPEDSEKDSRYNGFQNLRDFNKEVNVAGVSALKTDVAWVGWGYSMALNSAKDGYNILATSGKRPTVVGLDGWAGTQRYSSIWTGDQTGGNWEYIRFHIPTYIGQSLAGNPNVGSDVDGIFGGSNLITTRDLQFKTFTQTMLDMDGWGAIPKKPYIGAEPYTSINRMYLKLKAQLMPYIYTAAHESVDGLPMIRAMFLEEANPYTYGTQTQYQFMFGDNFLVAPIYQNTAADEIGNDIRNNIYLPGTSDTWIDYFTGKQYAGGQVVNNFDAPIWKLPLFVKNGAIIPMYEDNNNPMAITETNKKGLDKTRRIVEFYPYGTTSYDLVEDDGISMDLEKDGTRNYGGKVSTHMTSTVKDGKATLTVEASKGSYEGYDSNRHSTFVVNVSKRPTSIVAFNGTTNVNVKEIATLAEFERATANNEAGWYYDSTPNLNKYAKEGEEFAKTEIETSPKLFVSFPKTDVNANKQTLVLEGFANDGDVMKDQVNKDLTVPANVKVGEITPTTVDLSWDQVEGATTYEVLVDGILNATTTNSYKHVDLPYDTTHTYKVRARNAEGYSAWSDEVSAKTFKDPWRNVVDPVSYSGVQGTWGSVENAFDYNIIDSGFQAKMLTDEKAMILDYGKGYLADKFVFSVFAFGNGINYGGRPTSMDVSISLDGVNWEKVVEGFKFDFSDWNAETNPSTVIQLSKENDVKKTRFIKLSNIQTGSTTFSANGLHLHRVDESKPFAVGSIAIQGRDEVTDADYTNLKNYKGSSVKDHPTFDAQVKKYALDINNNDVYDVYDYAFTLFKLNGGTKQKGNVSGDITLVPSKKAVKAGETFTINAKASQVKYLNAFGGVLNYDPAAISITGVKQAEVVSQMENLTVDKQYKDGTAFYDLAFVNNGDQELYKGSDVLATITIKANKDIADTTTVFDTQSLMAIGPNYKVSTGVVEEIKVNEYKQEDFNITMTNKFLPTDDGKNVEKLIQQKSYDNLFNNVKHYSDGQVFEFLWNYDANFVDGKFPEYVTLPTTIHFDFKDAAKLTKVDLYNRESGNGSINSIEAVVRFVDGTTQEFKGGDFNKKAAKYSFVLSRENAGKEVAGVDITPLTADGEQMLTICEIDFLDIVNVDADKAELKKQIAVAEEIVANIDNYIPSTVEGLATLLEEAKLIDAYGNVKQAEIDKACADLAEANAKASLKANKEALQAEIDRASNIDATLYTPETVEVLKEALSAANTVNDDPEALQEEVDAATEILISAVEGLVEAEGEKPNPDKPDPENPDPEVKPNPDKPGTDDNTKPENKPEVKPEGDKEEKPVPPTGDTTPYGLLWSLFGIAGVAVLAAAKKSKKA